MTLCPECLTAERDPLHAVYTRALCCKARSVAETPRALQAQAFAAAVSGLSADEAEAVRERARALVKARREAA